MCCDSWGRKESDMTERLNCTELKRLSCSSSVVVRGSVSMMTLNWLLSTPDG